MSIFQQITRVLNLHALLISIVRLFGKQSFICKFLDFLTYRISCRYSAIHFSVEIKSISVNKKGGYWLLA